MIFERTKRAMEFDVFVPTYSVAFEYQGEQHYRDMYIFSSVTIVARDETKRKACSQYGITLIEIPYWWDKTRRSLVEMINKSRPDIVMQK